MVADHVTVIEKENYVAVVVRADNCFFPKKVFVFHSIYGFMVREIIAKDLPHVNIACDIEFVQIEDCKPFVQLLQLVIHKRIGFSTLKRIIDL